MNIPTKRVRKGDIMYASELTGKEVKLKEGDVIGRVSNFELDPTNWTIPD